MRVTTQEIHTLVLSVQALIEKVFVDPDMYMDGQADNLIDVLTMTVNEVKEQGRHLNPENVRIITQELVYSLIQGVKEQGQPEILVAKYR